MSQLLQDTKERIPYQEQLVKFAAHQFETSMFQIIWHWEWCKRVNSLAWSYWNFGEPNKAFQLLTETIAQEMSVMADLFQALQEGKSDSKSDKCEKSEKREEVEAAAAAQDNDNEDDEHWEDGMHLQMKRYAHNIFYLSVAMVDMLLEQDDVQQRQSSVERVIQMRQYCDNLLRKLPADAQSEAIREMQGMFVFLYAVHTFF